MKCPLPFETIGLNLRAALTNNEWVALGKKVRVRARFQCETCGCSGHWRTDDRRSDIAAMTGRRLTAKMLGGDILDCDIPTGHLECHEHWHLDLEGRVQTLVALMAVCERCHEEIHEDPKLPGTGWTVDMRGAGSSLFFTPTMTAEFRKETRFSGKYRDAFRRLLKTYPGDRCDGALSQCKGRVPIQISDRTKAEALDAALERRADHAIHLPAISCDQCGGDSESRWDWSWMKQTLLPYYGPYASKDDARAYAIRLALQMREDCCRPFCPTCIEEGRGRWTAQGRADYLKKQEIIRARNKKKEVHNGFGGPTNTWRGP